MCDVMLTCPVAPVLKSVAQNSQGDAGILPTPVARAANRRPAARLCTQALVTFPQGDEAAATSLAQAVASSPAAVSQGLAAASPALFAGLQIDGTGVSLVSNAGLDPCMARCTARTHLPTV